MPVVLADDETGCITGLGCGAWRGAAARHRRSKRDWALGAASLLEGRYVDSDQSILVLDHLNNHTVRAFYQEFGLAHVRGMPECSLPSH